MRAAIVILIGASLISAQSTTVSQSNVDPVLDQLRSSNWEQRSSAFEEATKLIGSHRQSRQTDDELRVGLINFWKTENENRTKARSGQELSGIKNGDSDQAAPAETWSEERSDYYGDLIGAVADLNDERAIPALLGAAATGGMATRGVARSGRKSLEPVLQQINSQDPLLAGGAVFVLRDMLEYRTLSDVASMGRIKSALRVALTRPGTCSSGARHICN